MEKLKENVSHMKIKEPGSAITHFIAMIMALFAATPLIIKALYPEIRVAVDVRCTAGVTPESKAAALETMKMCQIELVGEE